MSNGIKLSEDEERMLSEIRSHLGELHERWELEAEDRHCKSSEGYIEVSFSYPNWFGAGENKSSYVGAEPSVSISVYSYLFGPSRLHCFTSIAEAHREVLSW